MKCKVIILNMSIIAVMLFSFTINVSAIEYTDAQFYENAVTELKNSIDNTSLEILSALGFDSFTPEELSEITFENVLSSILKLLVDNMIQPVRFICTVLVILIFIALSGGMISASSDMAQYFETLSVLFISLITLRYLIDLFTSSINIIHIVCNIMKLLIPVLTAITAFSGNPALATSSSAVSLYISEAIILVCDEFLLSLLCIMVAFSGVLPLNGWFNGAYITELLKKIFNYILGLIAAVYSGVLTIRDIVSSEMDKISGNSIKFILGSSVPVVGGTLSEGLSATVSALSLFRNTFGITGIIIICVVVFPVFSGLICWYLALQVCEFLSSLFGNNKISTLMSSFRYVLSMIISLLIFIIFVFVISVSTVLILSNK